LDARQPDELDRRPSTLQGAYLKHDELAQPFALAMMAGLLFAFAAKGWFRFVAAGPGYVSLLLSLVRTAWLGWAIGLIVLLARARGAHKARLLAIGIVVGLLSLPLMLLEPVADRVTARFETMQDIGEDESLRARLALYGEFFLASAGNVVGEGIGSANLATKLAEDSDLADYRTIDSGVLEAMFVLGWPGTLLYLGGLCWLVDGAFGGRAERHDLAVPAAGAVVVAILAMTLSHNTLIGVGGSVLWTSLGLMLAARAFQRRSLQRLPVHVAHACRDTACQWKRFRTSSWEFHIRRDPQPFLKGRPRASAMPEGSRLAASRDARSTTSKAPNGVTSTRGGASRDGA
jgi:hypothetical protein